MDVDKMTPKEIDAYLRSEGIEPEGIATRVLLKALARLGAQVAELDRDNRDLCALMLMAEQQRDSARAVARVLAHAYQTDNRPPPAMVHEALTYPVVPTTTDGKG